MKDDAGWVKVKVVKFQGQFSVYNDFKINATGNQACGNKKRVSGNAMAMEREREGLSTCGKTTIQELYDM